MISDQLTMKVEPKNPFSSLLRIISKAYQWTWKHLPLVLRSTELNKFDMTNTIYIVTSCVAPTGGMLSI